MARQTNLASVRVFVLASTLFPGSRENTAGIFQRVNWRARANGTPTNHPNEHVRNQLILYADVRIHFIRDVNRDQRHG